VTSSSSRRTILNSGQGDTGIAVKLLKKLKIVRYFTIVVYIATMVLLGREISLEHYSSAGLAACIIIMLTTYIVCDERDGIS